MEGVEAGSSASLRNDKQENGQRNARLGRRNVYFPPMTMKLSWMGHPVSIRVTRINQVDTVG